MENFILFGTLVNTVLVIVGSLVGLLIRRLTGGKENRSALGDRISNAVFGGIGLCVLLIGIDGAIKGAVNGQINDAFDGLVSLSGERTLVIILSTVLGAVIGELLDIDRRMNALGEKIQGLMKGKGGNIAEGFVSASLLFCVGSMSVVGALNSGISGDHTLQITKGVMDLISSVIFASTFGVGVLFAAGFVLVYQGLLSLLAAYIAPFLTEDVIICMTAVGSLIIIALGLNLLKVTKIKIMNYLPAILLPVLLIPLWDFVAGLL